MFTEKLTHSMTFSSNKSIEELFEDYFCCYAEDEVVLNAVAVAVVAADDDDNDRLAFFL